MRWRGSLEITDGSILQIEPMSRIDVQIDLDSIELRFSKKRGNFRLIKPKASGNGDMFGVYDMCRPLDLQWSADLLQLQHV